MAFPALKCPINANPHLPRKKKNQPYDHLEKCSPLIYRSFDHVFFVFVFGEGGGSVILSNSFLQNPHATPCKVWPKDFCKFNQHLSGTASQCMNFILRQAVLCSRQQPTEARLQLTMREYEYQCFVACERFSLAALKAQTRFCVAAVYLFVIFLIIIMVIRGKSTLRERFQKMQCCGRQNWGQRCRDEVRVCTV